MSIHKKHLEPFWWTWFSTGGTAAAFILPVLLLFIGIIFPLGWIEPPSYEQLTGKFNIIIRSVLFVVVLLSLLHFAHRYRFTLYDGLQLQRFDKMIAVICYGTALILGIYAGRIMWNL